jgi:biofilm PGA synthesis N-glycosyltransferase PgaC
VASKREQVAERIAATAVQSAVFLDPTGRRWRRFRWFLVGAVALIVGASFYAFPKMYAAPALPANADYPNVTSAQTGLHVQTVGEGPLVRVLKVQRTDGQLVGYDPFTQARATTLTPAEASQAGTSQYVIQRFGYSATATRTMSLTFDDGPDPKYTPELLDVLSKVHVPATFFVTGKMIARYPEIIARESREGHAVGNHSLTHIDVSQAPGWRARAELTVTDREIRAVTHKEVAYFRLPYEGDDEATTQASIDGILRAQRWGYMVVSHDFDTEDWAYTAHPSQGNIPLPPLHGQNITVLMHDGGGSGRQMTVDYVKNKLIPYAKAQGYKFVTMPQVQPWLAERTHQITPSVWDKLTLLAVQWLFAWPNKVILGLFIFAVCSVILIGLVYALLAAVRQYRRRRRWYPTSAQMDLPVSVVLAAYNEVEVIRRTLQSILASDYPILDVVVVDDGSRDGTADVVREVARQDPRTVLIRQPNMGKAKALNVGLRAARGDYIVTLDADTVLAPQTVTNLIRNFAVDRAGTLAGVAGVVRVGNREQNLLTRWQALEYVTQIGVERAAQDAMGAISIVPGACAAWRKAAISEVGGYSDTTLAEDCDLCLSLHRAGWRVTQDDDAIAFTEAPADVDSLLAQRTRWTYGTLQSIFKHRNMLFRPRHGLLGLFVLPNYVLTIVMPVVFLPLIVVTSVLAVRAQGFGVLGIYFLIFLAAHLIVAAVGIALMREKPHHLLMVPVYRLVYEPLRAYLLYTSTYLALRGVRMGWKKLARSGAIDVELSSLGGQPQRAAVAVERTPR